MKKKRRDREVREAQAGQDKFQKPLTKLEAKTEAQAHYIMSINSNIITVGLGPAGTGKTFVAATLAVEALINKKVGRIVVTRPAVEAGRGLGFLPGDLDEKFEPYLAPVREVFERHLGKGEVDCRIKNGSILALPLEMMRGHTFDNSFVILDEAQNTTPEQMKMFLTRVGEWSKVVVNGDESQSDLNVFCGLTDMYERLDGMDGFGMCEFVEEDCVRSGIARDILLRYRKK